MTVSFHVEIEDLDEGVRAAALNGELDQATVATLKQALEPVIDAQSGPLLIDLSNCEFIDSSGLAALVAIRERVGGGNGRGFAVCCPETQVRRIFEITGLDGAMGLVETRDDALAALQAGASSSA
jgi:anti-sigma B factor antagonist